jgi:acyl-CoA thioesterase
MTICFEQLTTIADAGDGRFTVTFDDKTRFWSVNGGYIAAAGMRIAAAASRFQRPANVTCQFLRSCVPGAAEAVVTVVASHASAELIQVDIHQDGKQRATILIWMVDRKEGPTHRAMYMPLVPHPEELRTIEEIMRPDDPPLGPFWQPLEQRPVNRIAGRDRRPRSHRFFRWLRYRELGGASQVLAAASYLPVIDVMGVVAAGQMYDEPFLRSLAPTIQLAAHFYDLEQASDWFLCDSFCEHAKDGLVTGRVKIWSIDGELLAHGFSQMLVKDGSGAYVGGKPG